MKNRPLTILIVAIVFIITGIVGFSYHLKDFFDPHEKLYVTLIAETLRILALVCGILLFLGINWGRWLAIAWMLSHVLISAFNSISQMFIHIAFLAVISVLLFLPISSAFFRSKKKQ